MLGRGCLALVAVCVGCGFGVPPPCDQLPADRQFVCSTRSSKSYCVVCYSPSRCEAGKQQCFVRTSDEFIFSCDSCGGNRGCFEEDNAAVNAWCSNDAPARDRLPTPVCGQQGGATCMCAKRAIDLARAPVEAQPLDDATYSESQGISRFAKGNVLRPASSCEARSGKKCCFDSLSKICACDSVPGLTECRASEMVDDCGKAPW